MSTQFLDFALWFPLLVGIGVGLVLTRMARDLAARAGLVDCPDGRRKTQKQPVPVAGGLAVLATTVFAVALTLLMSPPTGPHFPDGIPAGDRAPDRRLLHRDRRLH